MFMTCFDTGSTMSTFFRTPPILIKANLDVGFKYGCDWAQVFAKGPVILQHEGKQNCGSKIKGVASKKPNQF
jgi:hypothetical protein